MPLAQCKEPSHCDKACGSMWQVVVPACCQGGDSNWVMRQLRLSETSRGLFSKLLLTAGSAMRSARAHSTVCSESSQVFLIVMFCLSISTGFEGGEQLPEELLPCIP